MKKNQLTIPDFTPDSFKAESIKLINVDFQMANFWEYCDNCGQKLVTRKCKLFCPVCGFFHSCSEP